MSHDWRKSRLELWKVQHPILMLGHCRKKQQREQVGSSEEVW
jgi:hypothetical protein